MKDYRPIAQKITQLIIYRNILEDAIVQQALCLLENNASPSVTACFTAGLIEKAETLGLSGDLFPKYLTYLIAQDENIFSIMTEKTSGHISAGLQQAAVHDATILKELFTIDWSALSPNSTLTAAYAPTIAAALPAYTWLAEQLPAAFASHQHPEAAVDTLLQYYSVYGYGAFANFKAFRWQDDHQLTAISQFDPTALDDIVGYESQKQVLLSNTQAFIDGKPANNVLLIGARGTGKSSSVKALANAYFNKGLRLIEISKQQMCSLPVLMDLLRHRPGKRFIIFLDDLSFEEFEVEYKVLKSVIEGGVETKPDNVLIYATSNRRHLIKETWQDRSGQHDDLHRFDGVHEKVSLSDRFGITITYLAPSQDEYLQIVEHLAGKHQIDLPPDQLRQQAIRWELAHSGRSGRTAQQFIKYIMGQ